MDQHLILVLFAIIVFIIDRIIAKVQFNHLQKEVDKAKLYCRLIDLEMSIHTDCLESDLSKYKYIKKYLATTSLIIERLGVHFNLDEIILVESKNKSYTRFREKFVKEYMSVDMDIKELASRKAHLVNAIAKVKHPVAYRLSIAKNAVLPGIMIALLDILLAILKLSIKVVENVEVLKKHMYKTDFITNSKSVYKMASTNCIIIDNE